MAACVYLITHVATARHYVGKTTDPRRRWRAHCQRATRGKKVDRLLINHAMAKHGVDAFRFQVLEKFETDAEALDAETYWIDFLGTHRRSDGFNMNHGGDGGVSPCAETREKIAAAHRGKTKHTEESRAALRAAHLGMRHSPESCAKMSASRMGIKQSAETKAKRAKVWTGRHHSPKSRAKQSASQRLRFETNGVSDETRAKMSAAHRGLKCSPEHRANIAAARLGTKLSPEAKALRAAKMAAKRAASAR